MEDIEASIAADDAFFKRFIDMIPPQFYLDQDTKHELADKQKTDLENKFKGKGKRRAQELSDKAKVKRLKYDPGNQKTVSEIQESLAEHVVPSSGDEESEDSEAEEDIPEYSSKKEKKQRNKKSKKERKKQRDTSELSHVDKYQMLQAKLRKKIEELQSRRLTPQEQIEKKRLKRKESKLKSKEKRRNKTHKPAGVIPVVNNKIVSPPGGKPIFNKEGKMVFSKFDFTDSGEKEKPSNPLTGRDYKKLLEKVEKRKQRIKELSEKNAEKGKELEDKIAWETALHKAQGVKVKDNPEMLKKAMKLKEKTKERKMKKWEERVERTEKLQNEKQDKRRKNIKAKKDANILRKIAKQKKKGRVIPGF